ncbi:hypothetical protein GCM10023185_20920 [Hymenobacter saemangeumensis]|uniref:Type I restriction modification DNA specificity domain-containing protein n=1 Tax=Hymenobacter saemangeumensis TaxID=1084522 RepID=A0ABP8IDX9_9BACT
MSKVRIGDLIQRRKELIKVEDAVTYKQVTIRIKHKGVVLRGTQQGATIGTKSQYVAHQNQFILSCIDARNGAFGIVPPELEGAIITNDFWCFDINEERVLREFFYTLIQAPAFDEACKKASIGTTNRQRINEGFFLNYELEIPPLEEQASAVTRIVAARQHLSGIEAEFNHQATLLTRMRQAILREAVQGRLLPQDAHDEPATELLARIRAEKQRMVKEKKLRPEKPLPLLTEADVPYALPQGWVWCRLGTLLLTLQTGPFGSALHKHDYVTGGTPVINPANIKEGLIHPSINVTVNKGTLERLSGYLLKTGDMVMGRRGEMGRCALVTEKETNWLCGTGSLILRFSTIPYLNYLALCFKTSLIKESLGLASVGTTMQNLNQKALYNIPFPLPPLAEQRRIVAKVAELLAHCKELEAELSRAQAAATALHAAALREAFAPVPAVAG